MHANLQYYQRHAIDAVKWDRCIDNARNGLIYAYSYYLDHMTTQWDALVWGDYEAVMPLPVRKKWGIQYVYQPAFVPSLGVFGNNLTEEKITQFIQAIPARVKLIDTRLNYGNIFSSTGHFSTLHSNYVLPLHQPYDTIYNGYRENIKRNIKRSRQLNNRYATDVTVEEVIDLSRLQMDRVSEMVDADYVNFVRLYKYLHQQQKAMACGVYTAAGELVASCVYFFSHNRAYYILVGNHPNGRTQGASHYLIDRFICDHAGRSLLLDFEGSDIRNLAFFYSSFGATTEIYPGLWMNRLPWYLKVLSSKY